MSIAGLYRLSFLLVCAACETAVPLPEETPAITTVFDIPFERAAPNELELWTHGGHVLVRHGPRLKCEVDVRVFASSEQEAAIRAASVNFMLTESQPGVERLSITHAEGAPLGDVDLQFRVEVPPHVHLRVLTLIGEVALRGARGTVEVQTRTGNVEARVASIRGARIRLETESGAVRLEGEYQDAQISTDTGRVQLVAPRQVAPCRALTRSGAGAITLFVDDQISVAVDHLTRHGRFNSEIPVAWERLDAPFGDGLRRSIGLTAGGSDRRMYLFATTENALTSIRRRFAGP